MSHKDLYNILQIGEKATPEEIKKAFRKLAKTYHPDTHPGDTAAAERFKEISMAYEVLSDPAKRKQYDQLRTYGPGAAGGFQGGPGYQGWDFGGTSGRRHSGRGFSFEDLGGFGDLGDIFKDLFDLGGTGRGGAPGSRRGQDILSDITVPFDTAIAGGKIIIEVPLEDVCPTCSGSGAEPGSDTSACPDCHGQGFLSFAQGAFAVNRPCPRCYGRGKIIARPCRTCQGQGTVRRRRRISVRIPPGVEDGSRIRLRGQGQPGTNGGPAGDLLLNVRVERHRFFQRRGQDLLCRVPINIALATLGGRLRVRTLDGKVELKIPPGTQSDTTFRLKGKGLSLNGKKGDQLVTVLVNIPRDLNERQRELMEKFARETGLDH
jgi:molecular chaperone DnaJ